MCEQYSKQSTVAILWLSKVFLNKIMKHNSARPGNNQSKPRTSVKRIN